MRKLFFILLMVLSVSATNWAVLVAGSHTFSNYRHQADVFHAYQALVKKGMPKQNILLMAYDDIPTALLNPFRGKVFNKPSYSQAGQDVYEGVQIDYSGKHVTPQVFTNLLLGNKSFVAGKGSGRVLQSNSNDNVFIFFSDHGAPGLISFPNEYLYADTLITTLNNMKGRYNKLVFYLETCESGSMFVNLPKNTKIYALSAAGTDQSSWATYCAPDDVVHGKHIRSCLGDLFSVSFIQDIDNNDINTQTLDQQFQKVKKLTNQSKVMQWGDTSFVSQSVQNFIGLSKSQYSLRKQIKEIKKMKYASISTYNVKFEFLTNLYRQQQSLQNLKNLIQYMDQMQKMDRVFFQIKKQFNLTGKYTPEEINFDCLRFEINSFENKCGKISQYGLQYVKFLAEKCEKQPEQQLQHILATYC